MVAISQLWYNGSYTIAAQPIKTLESHYTMIQFLIIPITPKELALRKFQNTKSQKELTNSAALKK